MTAKILSYTGWTIVWLLAFYFIYTNALRYFNINHEVYNPGFKPYAPYIMLHVAGGTIALVIGPLQFFNSIRRKYTSFHRTVGKTYLLCVLISGVSAVYLAISDNLIRQGDFMFGTGVLGMALSWFITSGMAFWSIINRNINQHKEWMIRSYVLTSNFIIFRLIFYGLLGMESFPFKDEVGGFTAWASWSVPLLITEMFLQLKKIKKIKRTAPTFNEATESLRITK